MSKYKWKTSLIPTDFNKPLENIQSKQSVFVA